MASVRLESHRALGIIARALGSCTENCYSFSLLEGEYILDRTEKKRDEREGEGWEGKHCEEASKRVCEGQWARVDGGRCEKDHLG